MKNLILDLTRNTKTPFTLYVKEGRVFRDRECLKKLSEDSDNNLARRIKHYYNWCQKEDRDYHFDFFYFPENVKTEDTLSFATRIEVFARKTALKRLDQNIYSLEFKAAHSIKSSQFAKHLSLLDETKDPVLVTEAEPYDNPGPRVIYANKAFTELTGYTEEEILGKAPRILQGKDNPENDEARKSIRENLSDWKSFSQTIRNFKKSGDPFTSELKISPVADETGWWTHWVSFQSDVTSLQLESIALKKIQENAKIGYWRMKPRSGEVFLTEEIYSIYSVQEGKFNFLKDYYKYFADHEKQSIQAKLKNCSENDTSFDEIYEFYDERKVHKWVRATGEPHYDHHGKLVEILGTFQDVTRFVEDNKRIKTILDNTPDIIYRLSREGLFTFVSKSWERLLGHKSEDIIGAHFKTVVHPLDLEKCERVLNDLFSGKEERATVEYRVLTKDGRVRTHRTNGVFISEGEPFFQGIASDISDYKELQDELKTILDATGIGVWHWNIPENQLYWDDNMYSLYKINKEDFSGALDAWSETIHPKYKDNINKKLQDSIEGKTAFNTEFLINAGDGSIKKISAIAVLERDIDGAPLVLKGINIDKTQDYIRDENKKEEEKRSIVQSRLAAIGELASGVGHEINNPLTIAIGCLRQYQKQKDVKDELLNKTSLALDRIRTITKGLKTLSHHHSEKAYFNITEALDESLKFIEGVYRDKGVTVSLNSAISPSTTIYANRAEIQQVLLNLLSNAFDATEGQRNREITINLSDRKEDIYDKVFIDIIDNGLGIDSSIQDKVFDSFFTTKEVGKGSGIGLSISRSIVEANDGKIDFTSQLGKGTCFTLIFSPSENINLTESQHDEHNSPEDESCLKDKKRVLIIDDEEGICILLKMYLEDKGFLCDIYTSGIKALESLEKDSPLYDVIITDIKMPDITGSQIVKKIREMELKKFPLFFMMTGGINNDHIGTEIDTQINGLFFKPFEEEEIYQSILKAINDPTDRSSNSIK